MKATGFRAAAIGIFLLALAVPATARSQGSPELTLTSQTKIDPRLLQLEFTTPAMADGEAAARVLLPPGYERTKRDYPVLYLLHGAGYDETGWTTEGDAEAIIGDRKLIVVMPNGGGNGYYTDWYNGGAFGRPAYETFHIDQLLPWIDANFRTRDDRGGRAIAGFSMGGFGAMSYAARHPDLFSGAYSFSGAIDTNYAPFQPIGEASSLADGGQYAAIFGQRQTQEIRWRGKNPWDLAPNLQGMALQIRTGNGLGGGAFGGPPLDPIEFGVHEMALSMDARLSSLGFPHLLEDYGPGAHQFPYYRRDLANSLPAITAGFDDPPPRPKRFTFRSIEPRFSVYGYRVQVSRPALEFSQIHGARNGKRFTLSGSGSAQVIPPRLKRRTSYSVRVRDDSGRSHRVVRTNRRGRLRVAVSLGAPNQEQQYTPAAIAGGGTKVQSATVRLRRKGRRPAATAP